MGMGVFWGDQPRECHPSSRADHALPIWGFSPTYAYTLNDQIRHGNTHTGRGMF